MRIGPLGWLSGCLLMPLAWAAPDQAGLPGFCSIGGEEIANTDPITKRKSPNDDYREIECRYTNGQTARAAVCRHHAETYTASDSPTMWESIKRGWSADMATWSRARREKYWAFYEGVTIQSCGGD